MTLRRCGGLQHREGFCELVPFVGKVACIDVLVDEAEDAVVMAVGLVAGGTLDLIRLPAVGLRKKRFARRTNERGRCGNGLDHFVSLLPTIKELSLNSGWIRIGGGASAEFIAAVRTLFRSFRRFMIFCSALHTFEKAFKKPFDLVEASFRVGARDAPPRCIDPARSPVQLDNRLPFRTCFSVRSRFVDLYLTPKRLIFRSHSNGLVVSDGQCSSTGAPFA